MKQPSILVVGSMNMDVMMYGVAGIGNYGESIVAKSYEYLPGGKGANQAIASAKLGAKSTMVGRLGDDEHGEMLLKNLAQYGVDAEDVVSDASTQTGLDPIMVDEKTARYVSYVVLGGNDLISPEQVEHALQRKSYDMILMQLEMPLETVYATYELGKQYNIPVFLDAGPAKKIPLERLKGIFIISPNEAETNALVDIMPDTAEKALEAAMKLYKAVEPEFVLLKLGERGALLYDGEKSMEIPCFSVDAIDSTGAGDTFNAGFAVRFCQGYSLEDSILFAHAAAGICVTRKGVQQSIPSTEEVEEFLRNNVTKERI